MLHPTYIGFFDRQAAQRREIAVRHPLCLESIEAALGQKLLFDRAGNCVISGDRISVVDGYVTFWDVIRSREAAEFVLRLARATSCDILFADTAQFDTPEHFMERFDALSQYRDRLRQQNAND